MRTLAVETVRTLPRLARLGQLNDHTRISLGRIIDEQAHDAPKGEFLLFDGRVHTYEAVNRRINNVVRGLIAVGVRQGDRVGVLMETRPSALVAIAALSRLGAVAVVMRPDTDLSASVRLGRVTEILTDPTNLDAARQLPGQVLVLGGGESRDLICRPTHLNRAKSSTWKKSTRTPSSCRRGIDRIPDWRGIWRSSRSVRPTATWWPSRSPTTAGRCRPSGPPRRRPSAAETRCTV